MFQIRKPASCVSRTVPLGRASRRRRFRRRPPKKIVSPIPQACLCTTVVPLHHQDSHVTTTRGSAGHRQVKAQRPPKGTTQNKTPVRSQVRKRRDARARLRAALTRFRPQNEHPMGPDPVGASLFFGSMARPFPIRKIPHKRFLPGQHCGTITAFGFRAVHWRMRPDNMKYHPAQSRVAFKRSATDQTEPLSPSPSSLQVGLIATVLNDIGLPATCSPFNLSYQAGQPGAIRLLLPTYFLPMPAASDRRYQLQNYIVSALLSQGLGAFLFIPAASADLLRFSSARWWLWAGDQRTPSCAAQSLCSRFLGPAKTASSRFASHPGVQLPSAPRSAP